MPQRILFPEWRAENEPTKYPFAAEATLSNGTQLLLDGTLLDASLYPIGGDETLYLSKAVLDHDVATLYVGTLIEPELASVTFDLIHPPDLLNLVDAYGRPAGVIVSESQRLGLIASWGVGEHVFRPEHTRFAATCIVPTPAVGVRGVRLADGSVLTGDVWLVGDDGVILRQVEASEPARRCSTPVPVAAIRVDIVGDPLFRRRLCEDADLFETPRFLKTLTFVDRNQTAICGPGEHGDVKITVNNDTATLAEPVLRIHPTETGTKIEVVGSTLKSVR